MILVHIHPLYPSKLRSEFSKIKTPTTPLLRASRLWQLILHGTEGVWSTMAFYMFSLHIPLSFGGMSVVSQILQEPNLDPQTEPVQAISLLVAQILELIGTLLLLKFTVKPQYNFMNFFKATESSKDRNWLLASAIGFGFLFSLVSITSFLADKAVEPKLMAIFLRSLFGDMKAKCSSILIFSLKN
nr:uncharacterized protein LOC107417298 isoform X3 [Ziziphus jujuba var. spinosa]XP_048327175.1 uncharacterized protein LOC107417298 isoform X3 [Ziziphus jujuba var. spinosa]